MRRRSGHLLGDRLSLSRLGVLCFSIAIFVGCSVIGGGQVAAPTGLAATVQSPTEALVTWKPTDGLTDLRIERRDGLEAPFREVGVTGPEASSHLNTGLTPGGVYVWRIRGCSFGACSPYTDEVSLTMPAAT